MSRLEDNAIGLNTTVFNRIDYTESREEMHKRAEKEGLVAVYPADDELFIDIDSANAYALMLNQLDMARQLVEMSLVRDTPSKSGLPHRHVVIKLHAPMCTADRIGLQAIMGNDRRCALLQYFHHINGEKDPILFLEKKNDKS